MAKPHFCPQLPGNPAKIMTTTSAERPQAYRAKRPFAGDNGERRLPSWVTTSTALALGRLARRAGTTQRAVLEQLIQNADRAVTQGMSDDEFDHYFALPCNKEWPGARHSPTIDSRSLA